MSNRGADSRGSASAENNNFTSDYFDDVAPPIHTSKDESKTKEHANTKTTPSMLRRYSSVRVELEEPVIIAPTKVGRRSSLTKIESGANFENNSPVKIESQHERALRLEAERKRKEEEENKLKQKAKQSRVKVPAVELIDPQKTILEPTKEDIIRQKLKSQQEQFGTNMLSELNEGDQEEVDFLSNYNYSFIEAAEVIFNRRRGLVVPAPENPAAPSKLEQNHYHHSAEVPNARGGKYQGKSVAFPHAHEKLAEAHATPAVPGAYQVSYGAKTSNTHADSSFRPMKAQQSQEFRHRYLPDYSRLTEVEQVRLSMILTRQTGRHGMNMFEVLGDKHISKIDYLLSKGYTYEEICFFFFSKKFPEYFDGSDSGHSVPGSGMTPLLTPAVFAAMHQADVLRIMEMRKVYQRPPAVVEQPDQEKKKQFPSGEEVSQNGDSEHREQIQHPVREPQYPYPQQHPSPESDYYVHQSPLHVPHNPYHMLGAAPAPSQILLHPTSTIFLAAPELSPGELNIAGRATYNARTASYPQQRIPYYVTPLVAATASMDGIVSHSPIPPSTFYNSSTTPYIPAAKHPIHSN